LKRLRKKMPAIAVAAISARAMAEAAVSDGFKVVALDLFGDTDTRRAGCRSARPAACRSMQPA
jgi:predicted ATP-grasp superfamily ATP-dependent carboligase